MAKEVWEQVKEVEAQAGKLIEDAKLQSVNIVKKAREEANELLKSAETKAVNDGELSLTETVKKAQAFKEQRIRELKTEQQSLTKTGEARINGAVNMILEKVVR